MTPQINTYCKELGGNITDVETTPGYVQCNLQGVGYCSYQPVDADHPTGLDCQPAPVATVMVTPAATPTTLPAVGGGDWTGLVFIIILALLGGFVASWLGDRKP